MTAFVAPPVFAVDCPIGQWDNAGTCDACDGPSAWAGPLFPGASAENFEFTSNGTSRRGCSWNIACKNAYNRPRMLGQVVWDGTKLSNEIGAPREQLCYEIADSGYYLFVEEHMLEAPVFAGRDLDNWRETLDIEPFSCPSGFYCGGGDIRLDRNNNVRTLTGLPLPSFCYGNTPYSEPKSTKESDCWGTCRTHLSDPNIADGNIKIRSDCTGRDSNCRTNSDDCMCAFGYVRIFNNCISCPTCDPGTGANCEFTGVVNNECKYETSCETGYVEVSGKDTAKPVCRPRKITFDCWESYGAGSTIDVSPADARYFARDAESSPPAGEKMTPFVDNATAGCPTPAGYKFSAWWAYDSLYDVVVAKCDYGAGSVSDCLLGIGRGMDLDTILYSAFRKRIRYSGASVTWNHETNNADGMYHSGGGGGGGQTDCWHQWPCNLLPKQELERPGYTLDDNYWNTESDGTGIDYPYGADARSGSTFPDGMTLYAKWHANDYPLTYDCNAANNGAGTNTTVNKKMDEDVILEMGPLSCKPNGVGKFLGWYSAPTDGSKIIAIRQRRGGATVYAHWEMCPPCNAGPNANCDLSIVINECHYDTSCKPGYELVRGENTPNPICTPKDYPVVYDCNVANGGGGVNTETMAQMDSLVKIATDKLSCEPSGVKTFDGWYDSPTGGNVAQDQTQTEAGIKVYARWTDCPLCNAVNAECNVSVDYRNECQYSSSCNSGYIVESGQHTANPICRLRRLTYDCNGTGDAGSTVNIPPDQATFMQTADQTDEWAECGFGLIPFRSTADAGCVNPPVGYTHGYLTRWSLAPDFQGQYTNQIRCNLTRNKDAVVYAVWSKYVRMHPNYPCLDRELAGDLMSCWFAQGKAKGGTGGDCKLLSNLEQWEAYKCNGYTLDSKGWFLSKDGTGPSVPFGADVGTSNIAVHEANLYANWIPNDYPLTYDCNSANGGTGTNTTVTKKMDEDVTLETGMLACKPAGASTFVGWYSAPNGGEKLTAIKQKVDGTTVYARWAACPACNAGANCTCAPFVENNTCKYETGAQTGYVIESGAGTQNPICKVCGGANYIQDGQCKPCPAGYDYAEPGDPVKTSINDCKILVDEKHHLKTATKTDRPECPVGTWSTRHTVNYGNTSNCEACSQSNGILAGVIGRVQTNNNINFTSNGNNEYGCAWTLSCSKAFFYYNKESSKLDGTIVYPGSDTARSYTDMDCSVCNRSNIGGYYLGGDGAALSEEMVICPVNHYCPFNRDNKPAFEVGESCRMTRTQMPNDCPPSHPSSAEGSDDRTDCFNQCEPGDVENSLTVTGVRYYPDNSSDKCKATSCKPGFRLKDGKCVDRDISCEAPHATDAVISWNDKTQSYGVCTIKKCAEGFYINSNVCTPETRKCTVENGRGTQEFDARQNKWGECEIESCDPGFTTDRGQTTEWTKPCGACKNKFGVLGEVAVSSYVKECEIATCMYANEKYTLENNECRLICDITGRKDETGTMKWNAVSKKCERTCNPGFTMW